jgi:hypothetical protein
MVMAVSGASTVFEKKVIRPILDKIILVNNETYSVGRNVSFAIVSPGSASQTSNSSCVSSS